MKQKIKEVNNIEEIKKALKCCATGDEMQCWLCPYIHNPDGCLTLPADALEAIEELEKARDYACMEARIANRKREEILIGLVEVDDRLKTAKVEAVKEFADLAIKTICEKVNAPIPSESYIVEKCIEIIDDLVKERVGEV